MTNFVGNDISKRDFHAALNERDEVLKFTNDRKGIAKFLRLLKESNLKPENTVIGMESTGFYHLLPAFICKEKGYTVNIINPLITRRQNQASVRNAKTDPIDAKLVRYCTAKGEGHPFAETAESLHLKTLVRQRNYCVALRTKMKLRQQSMDHREDCIKTAITPVNKDLHNILAVKIKELDKQLSRYSKELQKLLRTIPGIGPQTAITLISEIGDINRFPSSKQLTAFIGVDPRVHQSGTSINKKGHITKRGSSILRTRLYNASTVAVFTPNIFQEFFRKKRSEGKPYRKALCATMHKMVHVIYAVWTRGTPFINEKG